MKIALACDWFLPRLGGIELHLRDLAQRLARAGHDVCIVTPSRGPEIVDDVRVQRLRVPLLPRFQFACTPALFHALDALMRRERFDVVHAHASIVSPTAYGAAFVARQRRIPVALTFHSVLRNHARWLGPVVRTAGVPTLDVALTAVSGVVAREAAALLDGRSVAVLPNGLDAAPWRATRHDGQEGLARIVAAMRLTPKKRPRALLDIMRRVRDRVPSDSFRLDIAGEGSEQAALERRIRRLALADVVRLRGRLPREDLRALYAHSDIFVLPAVLESFGIAVLEARAAGLPVVIRREAGVAELLRHEEDGLFAASDDEMVEQLVRLIMDTGLRDRIAAHNRAVPSPASWESVLQQHLAMYGALITSPSAAAPVAAAP